MLIHSDEAMMARAISLAKNGWFTTQPNPRVGCVIVNDGEIVGQGWHERAGEPHAEVHALRAAAERARGATAYVTLEPCSHYGRTPPCASALIEAGIKKVVVGCQDPNPQVAGKGIAMLQAAGIKVVTPLLEADALALNEGFFKRMSTSRPLVRAKLAMSLDGRTAMASGESQWITGPDARSDVQRLRAQSSAIITGVGSILHDDSSLTVRRNELKVSLLVDERQPLRVVLDSQLQTPVTAKVIHGEGNCLIVASEQHDAQKCAALEAAGAEVLVCGEQQVDIAAVLDELGRRQCNEVLLETGATLAGSMMEQGLIDELVVYMAPVLMGSSARPLMQLPFDTMPQKIPLKIVDVTAIGQDWRFTARRQ